MAKFAPSIRRKITLGYYLCLALILAVAGVTYFNLLKVEKKVASAEVIQEFFETTLEARRYEKNYFLFEKEEDYAEGRAYLYRALEIIDGRPEVFDDSVPGLSAAGIREHYEQYGRLLEKAHDHIGTPHAEGRRYELQKEALIGLVRAKGKEITAVTERMSSEQRETIRRLLKYSRRLLWGSLAVLVAVGVVLGHVMATKVVGPLKLLEKYTAKVSRGEFVRYEGGYREKEVDSLLRAFNRMTTELEARQRQLVRSEKLASLGTLLSGVAHELNNPLSNISTSAQILDEELDGPDGAYKKELIVQIEEQSDKARDIVRTLLEFSREKEFKRQALELRQVLQETKMLVRGQLPTKVEVKLSVPEGLYIEADKQRIQQVFLNLVTNALDAVTEEGHVEVSASEYADPDGSRWVHVDVSDDGSGIDPDLLPRIFDPFFTTKDVGRGSGLGLFIVHDIIERHGGAITVVSEIGEGTTFHIRLPQGERAA